MILTVNISKKGEYYTQRNNALYPLSSCGVTSLINGLVSSGIPFSIPKDSKYKQPEDYLSALLDSPDAWNVSKSIAPNLINHYPPRLIHSMLEWAVNKLVGYQVDTFVEHASLQVLVFNIWVNGCCCIMDGKFTKSGHIICPVGFVYENNRLPGWRPRSYSDIEISRIKEIIVDDSYGNYLTNYGDQKGDDVHIPFEVFNNLTNSLGNATDKRMHILSKVGLE